MLKQIINNYLAFIALILSSTTFIVNAEAVVSVCNGCNSSTIETMALKSQPYGGIVHIVDFTTGQVKSFDIEHDSEPGFEFHYALSISTNSEIAAAAKAVNDVIKTVQAKGGTFDSSRGILTKTVLIPADKASTSTDVRDYLISQDVSQYLREQLLKTFWQQLSASWRKVVAKILLQVKAKFVDGSTAIYTMGPIFFSEHPFILERDSLKDKNGKQVSNDGSGGSGSKEDISYDDSYVNTGLQGFALQCRSYTISSSGGASWSGFNCWYVGIP